MSGSQTQNFDVIYEITTQRFVEALRNLFINDLPMLLDSVLIAVPGPLGNVIQSGTVALPMRPMPAIELDPGAGGNVFTLRLAFPSVNLTLQPIGVTPGTFGRPIGPMTLTMHLSIGPGGGGLTIAKQRASTATPPAISGTPLPLPSGGNISTFTAAVQDEVTRAVIAAIEAVLPIDVQIALPSVGGPCDIRPREIRTQFLAGDGGHAEALAFLLALRPSSVGAGNAGALTTSHIESAREGVMLVANALLRDLICCLLPRSTDVSGLPTSPTEVTADCCRWRDLTNVRFGTETFPKVNLFEVCIGNNSVDIRTNAEEEGDWWHAEVKAELHIGLHNNGTTIVPVNAVAPMIEVDASIDCIVWLLIVLAALALIIVGAVVGWLIGGPAGATGAGIAIGAGVGLLVGAIVTAAILVPLCGVVSLVGTTVGGALGTLANAIDALQLVPTQLTSTFGALDLLGDPIIDDLKVGGRVLLPESHNTQSESSGIVVDVGGRLDLDHGTLFALTDPADLDADLRWTVKMVSSGRGGTIMLGTLAALGSARLVTVNDAFVSLTETEVAALPFHAGSETISSLSVPLHDGPNPPSMKVFAVRTTEGRLAKCGVWRDSSRRLHVRYRTWDTPRPLYITAQWTSSRGPSVGFGSDGLLPYVEHEVSRRGAFRAHVSMLASPFAYRWYWNGTPLGSHGTLPGDGATYSTSGAVCELRTPMGGSLHGDLCVTVTDAYDRDVTACRAVAHSGTERLYDRSAIDRLGTIRQLEDLLIQPVPLGDPVPDVLTTLPLQQQLPIAIANGMKLDVDKIVLR